MAIKFAISQTSGFASSQTSGFAISQTSGFVDVCFECQMPNGTQSIPGQRIKNQHAKHNSKSPLPNPLNCSAEYNPKSKWDHWSRIQREWDTTGKGHCCHQQHSLQNYITGHTQTTKKHKVQPHALKNVLPTAKEKNGSFTANQSIPGHRIKKQHAKHKSGLPGAGAGFTGLRFRGWQTCTTAIQ